MRKPLSFLLLATLLVACVPLSKTTGTSVDPYVVMLSMDGFRWDYPGLYHTPNLDRIAAGGVKAVSLIPSYPTKTFPNHYSIATGLYPDHHGIVQNSFYDPVLDRVFRMGDRGAVQDSIFWEGEAIWETAESQGMKTASYFWVGSESNETYRPGYRKFYESGFPYRQQIDTVIHWLEKPRNERPRLILFYFDEPDLTSHSFGPVCEETRAVVEDLDRKIGQLLQELNRVERKININVNLVIVSDHGMGNVPEGNQVFLEDILDLSRIRRINGGNPVITLEPESAYADEAYRLLRSAAHLKVWTRDELPYRYHYGTHVRTPGLIVEADSAYGLEVRRKEKGEGRKDTYGLGTHGYDPWNKDMHGIFYAIGPAFKENFIQPSFENTAIYGLLAHILSLTPAKNDGDFNTIKSVLRDY